MTHPYLSVQAEKESGLSDKLVGFAEKGITNVDSPVGAARVCVASHFGGSHGRRRFGRGHEDHLGLLGLSARLDDIPFGGSTASQPTSERDYGQSRGQTNNFERD